MRRILEIIDERIIEKKLSRIQNHETVVRINESYNSFEYSVGNSVLTSAEIPYEKLEFESNRRKNSRVVLGTSIALALLLSGNLGISALFLVLGSIGYVYLRTQEIIKSINSFDYNISSVYMLKYIEFTKKLGGVESNYIWYVKKQPKRLDYEKFNSNGHLVLKEEVEICDDFSGLLRMNIKPAVIKGLSISLVFLPDFILCELSEGRFIFKYSKMNLTFKESNIIEDTLNPRESETVEMTQNHPGKGSKLVPIKKYGELVLQQNDKKITLLTSNTKAAKMLEEVLVEYIAFYNS